MSSSPHYLGDDHIQTRFTTRVSEPTGKEVVGVDGRPVNDWIHGGSLEQTVTYNGTLGRLDGRYTLLLEWVNLENTGVRVVLPHEVVKSFIAAERRLAKQARKSRAKRGYETRLENSGGNIDWDSQFNRAEE
tara:strand:+ start:947 stop:1342 length:396 start_codon:yes stop_codon:yes gene_type:complete